MHTNIMERSILLLVLLSVVLLVIGFFRPQTSLFWRKAGHTRQHSALIYLGVIAFLVFTWAVVHAANNPENYDREESLNINFQENRVNC